MSAKIEGESVAFTFNVPVLVESTTVNVPLSSTPSGSVAPDITLSFGQEKTTDCVAKKAIMVDVTWTASLLESTDKPVFGCTKTTASTAFVAAYPDTSVAACGKCEYPIVCDIWDGIVAGVKKRFAQQVEATLRAALDKAATEHACAKTP